MKHTAIQAALAVLGTLLVALATSCGLDDGDRGGIYYAGPTDAGAQTSAAHQTPQPPHATRPQASSHTPTTSTEDAKLLASGEKPDDRQERAEARQADQEADEAAAPGDDI